LRTLRLIVISHAGGCGGGARARRGGIPAAGWGFPGSPDIAAGLWSAWYKRTNRFERLISPFTTRPDGPLTRLGSDRVMLAGL